MTAVKRLLGVDLRPSGLDRLPDRPTLFVVNHFTRFETILVPYVLHLHDRRWVRTLADDGLFKGAFGRYLTSCGVMSTRDSSRNRTIVSQLMTGRFDWVIYPEGRLLKNRKVVRGKELMLELPERSRPPHTGGAVLALQAELERQKYLEAAQRGDRARMASTRDRFGVVGPGQVSAESIAVVPVTITYHPMRSDRRTANRVLERLRVGMRPELDEEMQVEWSMLLAGLDVSIRFGEPIDVAEHVRTVGDSLRGLLDRLRDRHDEEVYVRGKAKRLTNRFMREIYTGVEINLEHLLGWAARALAGKRDRIESHDLRKALYLAACELRERDDVHLHPTLVGDLTPLIAGESFPAWARAMAFLEDAGWISRDGEDILLHADVIGERHGFHEVRVESMPRVVTNELEPVRAATKAVERMLGLRAPKTERRVRERVLEDDRRVFELARADCLPGVIEGDRAAPFMLNGLRSEIGVVLIHGYLAAPEEMRQLAAQIHDAGLNVYGVRLEGHGTTPRHLIDVHRAQWLDSIRRGMEVMRYHSKRIVLGGFSLGGLLALHTAADAPRDLAGVFSINAPVRLRDPLAPFVPLISRLEHARRALGLGEGLRVRRSRVSESPDINYDEDYLNGVAQVIRAMRATRRRVGLVEAPALVAQALDDPVVHASSGRWIHERLASDHKRLIELPLDRHIIVRGEHAGTMARYVLGFIEEIRVGASGTAAAQRGADRATPSGRSSAPARSSARTTRP